METTHAAGGRFREKWTVQGAFALAVYFLTAIVFTWPVAREINRNFIGQADAYLFTWDLKWWPFALLHHHNPFISDYIYAPVGANLTWTTPVPLLSILAWPLGTFFGFAALHNLLYLGSLALSALAAFLLGRYVTKSFGAGLLAGFVYGFSPYMMAQCLGHLNLVFSPFLPLIALAVLSFMQGRIGGRGFSAVMALMLLCQLMTYEETFALLTLVAAISFAAGYLLSPKSGPERRKLAAAGKWILLSYFAAAAAFSPYLYYQFLGPPNLRPPSRLIPPNTFVTDLANVLVPTRMQLAGGSLFSKFTERFTGNPIEWGGYLGLPLLAILILAFGSSKLPSRLKWFLLTILLLVMLLSLGPSLHAGGKTTWLMLPWSLLDHLPLMRQAMPCRLMVFVFLISAVTASLWFASTSRIGKLVSSVLIVVSFFPALPYRRLVGAEYPRSSGDVAQLRSLVPKGSTTLVLPFDMGNVDLSYAGSSMLYQVASGFWMKIPEAYTGTYTPEGFQQHIEDQRSFSLLPRTSLHAAMFNGLLEKDGISSVLLREEGNDHQAWKTFLTNNYGPPSGGMQGLQAWRLGGDALSRMPAVKMDGDYFLAQTDLDASSWMGRELHISTRKMPLLLALSGEFRPLSLPPAKIEVEIGGQRQSYLIGKDSMVLLRMPEQAEAKIIAEETFVPDNILGNSDNRSLSVMFGLHEEKRLVGAASGESGIKSLQFGGDCFFDVGGGDVFSWMGGSMNFETSGFPAKLVLSGECRPPSLPPVRMTVWINGVEEECSVGTGTRIEIPLPVNASVKVHAGLTFTPSAVLGNGDNRHLSVMFLVSESSPPR